MKKKYILLAAAVVAAFGLTACSTSQSGSGSNTSDNAAGQAAEQSADNDGAAAVENADDSGVDASATFDAENQSGIEVNMSDEEYAADGEETGWVGTFVGTSDETLSISAQSDTSVTFLFESSGIGGKASLDGSSAVFNGDDGFQINMSLDGDTIEVSLANTEDESASLEESPLIGTYFRQ